MKSAWRFYTVDTAYRTVLYSIHRFQLYFHYYPILYDDGVLLNAWASYTNYVRIVSFWRRHFMLKLMQYIDLIQFIILISVNHNVQLHYCKLVFQ
jgi:hypothetical protein